MNDNYDIEYISTTVMLSWCLVMQHSVNTWWMIMSSVNATAQCWTCC